MKKIKIYQLTEYQEFSFFPNGKEYLFRNYYKNKYYYTCLTTGKLYSSYFDEYKQVYVYEEPIRTFSF